MSVGPAGLPPAPMLSLVGPVGLPPGPMPCASGPPRSSPDAAHSLVGAVGFSPGPLGSATGPLVSTPEPSLWRVGPAGLSPGPTPCPAEPARSSGGAEKRLRDPSDFVRLAGVLATKTRWGPRVGGGRASNRAPCARRRTVVRARPRARCATPAGSSCTSTRGRRAPPAPPPSGAGASRRFLRPGAIAPASPTPPTARATGRAQGAPARA